MTNNLTYTELVQMNKQQILAAIASVYKKWCFLLRRGDALKAEQMNSVVRLRDEIIFKYDKLPDDGTELLEMKTLYENIMRDVRSNLRCVICKRVVRSPFTFEIFHCEKCVVHTKCLKDWKFSRRLKDLNDEYECEHAKAGKLGKNPNSVPDKTAPDPKADFQDLLKRFKRLPEETRKKIAKDWKIVNLGNVSLDPNKIGSLVTDFQSLNSVDQENLLRIAKSWC
jgi:hypothetical protein